jgi:hypothetical protein
MTIVKHTVGLTGPAAGVDAVGNAWWSEIRGSATTAPISTPTGC